MKLLCISASNVRANRVGSASTKVCSIIKDIIISKLGDNAVVDIIRLVDYDLKPCIMCGECTHSYKCKYDEDFNTIFNRIAEADGVFIVSPHYASIPSKLMIILEKLEEFAYLHYFSKNNKKFILKKKRVSIIGHGGQIDNFEEYYMNRLLNPISSALGAVQMKVIGLNDEQPNGVVFGIKQMFREKNSVLPVMEHDWVDIKKKIAPLVFKLLRELK